MAEGTASPASMDNAEQVEDMAARAERAEREKIKAIKKELGLTCQEASVALPSAAFLARGGVRSPRRSWPSELNEHACEGSTRRSWGREAVSGLGPSPAGAAAVDAAGG